MTEGVTFFILGILIAVVVGIAVNLASNDILARRMEGPFSTSRKSPNYLREEYRRAKLMHDSPMLLGLNVAINLMIAVELVILMGLSTLVGLWMLVFIGTLSAISPFDIVGTRVMASALAGFPVILMAIRAVLDLRSLAAFRDDLRRLVDFDRYEKLIQTQLGEALATDQKKATRASGKNKG